MAAVSCPEGWTACRWELLLTDRIKTLVGLTGHDPRLGGGDKTFDSLHQAGAEQRDEHERRHISSSRRGRNDDEQQRGAGNGAGNARRPGQACRLVKSTVLVGGKTAQRALRELVGGA